MTFDPNLYVPRADVEAMLAAGLRKARPGEVHLELTQGEAVAYRDCLEEVVYLYSNAASVLDMVGRALLDGDKSPELAAVCEVGSIAFRCKAETSGEMLEGLGRRFSDVSLTTCSGEGA